MAPTDGLRELALTPAHVAAALALSAEAGWNQNEADWRLMIGNGQAFGLETPDGALVASALTLPYPDGGFAWISMVLVTATWRRRGLATRLMQICMDACLARDLTPVLDATPAGAKVYGALGFEPGFGLLRMHVAAPEPGNRARLLADLAEIAADDRRIFGADRRFILADMHHRAPQLARVSDGGYALGRDGRTAWQLGPLTADALSTATALSQDLPGPVLIDVPESQTGYLAWLADRGSRVQRPYTRMAYRRRSDWGDPARTFAIAGPELG